MSHLVHASVPATCISRKRRRAAKAYSYTLMCVLTGGSIASADADEPGVRQPIWAGPYVGVHFGGGWADAATTNVSGGTEIAFHPAGGGTTLDLSGVMGGGQIGYNWQLGNWVFGLEGSASATSIKDRVAQPYYSSPADTTVQNELKIQSIYSLTAKLGYAWDRWLFSVNGGLATAELEKELTRAGTNASIPFATASGSRWQNGWTIGLGADYRLSQNLTLGFAYSYYDFGTRTHRDPRVISSPFFPPLDTVYDVDVTAQTATVRLNYVFSP